MPTHMTIFKSPK